MINSGGDSMIGGTRPSDGYGQPSYSVKYLGIVDGAMGILSRKMALQGGNKND